MTNNNSKAPENKKQGGFFSNLIFNIIIPTVILTQFSGEDSLGPVNGIIVALAFPIGFGIWDLIRARKINAFSIIGIISVGLTGGFSLLQLDPEYIAIKEAAIPGVIGLAVLLSNKTRFPLVKKLILNEQLINMPALQSALEKKNNVVTFEKRVTTGSLIVASSFFLSSALNYILAKVLLVSPPGSTAYNEELGRMTALSYPVIVIPSMLVLFLALWYLFSQIGKLTGQSIEDFIIDPDKPQATS